MKKRNLKFNVLDSSVIILFLLFLIGYIVNAQFKSINVFRRKEKSVTVSVDVLDTAKTLSKSVKSGEKIYLPDSNGNIGTIKAVVDRNNKNYVPVDDEFEIVFSDDLYRVLIKFDATVYETENGMFLKGNHFIANGSVFEFKTEKAVFTGTVSEIKLKSPSQLPFKILG